MGPSLRLPVAVKLSRRFGPSSAATLVECELSPSTEFVVDTQKAIGPNPSHLSRHRHSTSLMTYFNTFESDGPSLYPIHAPNGAEAL